MSRDNEGLRRGATLGEDASGTTGRLAGEVGGRGDHILTPQHAQTEGMPEPEEDPREGPEDHGHVDIEHELPGPPAVQTHEVVEPSNRINPSGDAD